MIVKCSVYVIKIVKCSVYVIALQVIVKCSVYLIAFTSDSQMFSVCNNSQRVVTYSVYIKRSGGGKKIMPSPRPHSF